MICCRECLELLNDYIDGSLDTKIRDSLEDHFKDCPPCISFLNTYKSASQVCKQTLEAEEIPEIVQTKLREFVQDTLKKAKEGGPPVSP